MRKPILSCVLAYALIDLLMIYLLFVFSRFGKPGLDMKKAMRALQGGRIRVDDRQIVELSSLRRVVVLLGSCDISDQGQCRSKIDIERGYRRMVHKASNIVTHLHNSGVQSVTWVQVPYCTSLTDGQGVVIRRFNEFLHRAYDTEVCAISRRHLLRDGIHLTNNGTALLLATIRRAIRRRCLFPIPPIQPHSISFFKNSTTYFELSNFFMTPVKSEGGGRVYPSAEHAYQAQKALLVGDKETHDAIADANTPDKAKHIANSVQLSEDQQGEWDYMRVAVMLQVLRSKFEDPAMRAILRSTGQASLHECNPTDTFWGTGLPVYAVAPNPSPDDCNVLGQLLVTIRTHMC